MSNDLYRATQQDSGSIAIGPEDGFPGLQDRALGVAKVEGSPGLKLLPFLRACKSLGGGAGWLVCLETGVGVAQAKSWELGNINYRSWVLVKGWGEGELGEWL